MSKKDKYLPLSDLAKYLIDEIENSIVDYDLVLSDWKISGRAGRRTLKHKYRLVVTTESGKKYALFEEDVTAYENGDLTYALPKKSLSLTT